MNTLIIPACRHSKRKAAMALSLFRTPMLHGVRFPVVAGVFAAVLAGAVAPQAAAQQASSGSSVRKSPSSSRVVRSKRGAEKKEEEEKPCPNPWPELTDEEQEAAVAKQKAFLDSIPGKVGLPAFPYVETQRFFFGTDLPGPRVAPVLPALDAMYKGLCDAFGLDKNKNIWRGKAMVVAFARRETFQKFELTFFHQVPDNAQGLAHLSSTGEVRISCYYGDVPSFFPVVIVHETTHGFMHRYRSMKHVPSWIDEGAADWIAGVAVRNDGAVRRRQSNAIAQIRATRSLGGDFFFADHIRDVQYGIASSMTDFLLRMNPKAYRKLINGVKDGLDWQTSLKESYGMTPQELAYRYGLSIGVPGVMP